MVIVELDLDISLYILDIDADIFKISDTKNVCVVTYLSGWFLNKE